MLAGIAAVPLFSLAIYQAVEDRAAAFDLARQEALLVARSQAALQAAVLERTRYVLAGAAATLSFDPSMKDCGTRLQRIVTANDLHANALLADRSGTIRCSVETLTKPINIKDRAYFRAALESGFGISALVTSRLNGVQRIVAAYPLADDRGQVLGVLIATLSTERISASMKAAPIMDGAVVVLVDGEGRQVARFPDLPGFLGKKLPGFVPDGAAHGLLDFVGLDGITRVAAFARVPMDSPLYIVAGLPRDEIERGPREALFKSIAILLVVLGGTLGISYFGAHRLIVAPLRRLTRAAERYDGGDLKARSGLGAERGEIGTLARTFDQLAAHNERTTRALKTLSAGNRTLLREKDEAALMGAMCRVAVENGGYRLALVNHAQHDERKSVRTMAQAGHDDGFVERLDLTWADSERGRGSVGTAIRTGNTCVVRSLARDPRFAPWRDDAIARGYGSIASFPLRIEGQVIGTLSIIAAEEDAFDHSELELLDEMAADLSFGIEVLRRDLRRVAAEEKARHATTHDPITGLPGRIPFMLATTAAAAKNDRFAVVIVNLPGLQDLHDSLGLAAVQCAVMEGGARLKSGMNPATGLSRIASDDFAMLLPNGAAAESEELARRLHALFRLPVDVDGAPIDVRMSVGAALFPDHGSDPEVLVRRAGIAAREAARRESAFLLYQGSTDRENPERLRLAAELRQAIDQRQLVLHFQSKVELAWGGVRGAEALVRWPHATRGMVPPMQFVPIAEQTGLIRPLTSLVLELAVRQLHAWRARPRQIPIAVNLSPRNLHDAALVDEIERLLGKFGVAAELLELEITESALAEDPLKAREVLQRLRALGCKLYIDDFGTGYSSLSYLVSLPVHAIKIDRSFVRQMAESREAHAVVSSIILMARELGLGTVAEGVETREDADMLLKLGCNEAQGYFFAKPVSADLFSG
jgi:EAL domain-containing protein (putative c-di-GMP-specific phosphodiesterase class I)/GGDEF domain-containing protein/HAMP domain-containing protein